MNSPAQNLLWEETFVTKFHDEVAIRKAKCQASLAVKCPTCGADVQKPCGYIAYDKHFGEDLPDQWTHSARREAHRVEEQKALESML